MSEAAVRPRALVRPPSPAYARCLRSAAVAVDPARALRQHEGYRAALSRFADVVALEPEPELPDACFVEDTAVVWGRVAVITRPGAETRRGEIPSIERALSVTHECRRVERGFIDGGDVMLLGRTAYVGLSSRTDREGASELARLSGLELRVVPLGPWLHLKTAVTPLGVDAVIQMRGAYPSGTFSGVEIIETDEPLGANVLLVGAGVLVSALAPRTAALLANRGLRAHAVEASEFHAGDAGMTCLSLILG